MATQPIVHIEIVSKDPKAAGNFYKDVFGWKIEADNHLDYTMFTAEPGPAGGIPRANEEQNMKPGDIILYINSDDINADLARIGTHGGKTLVPKTEITGMGWFAIFSDPPGTRLALFQAMNGQM